MANNSSTVSPARLYLRQRSAEVFVRDCLKLFGQTADNATVKRIAAEVIVALPPLKISPMSNSTTVARYSPASFELNCRCPAQADEDCPLTAAQCQQRLDLRRVGFSAEASTIPRDEAALRLLCAFNGVDWRKAPPGWWFHPNEPSRESWKRVADEARAIFGDQHGQ